MSAPGNTTAPTWAPALAILSTGALQGIEQSFYERQTGGYVTEAEALRVACALLKTRPDAIGATALRDR